jgi:hypothetical protein
MSRSPIRAAHRGWTDGCPSEARHARIATALKENDVSPTTASVLAVATTVAAALAATAMATSKAYADDITIDNTPFVSSRSRAEVRDELMRPTDLVKAGTTEWTLQQNSASPIKSSYSSQQAKAEYKTSRQLVSALNGEDSGSAYFMKRSVGPRAKDSATMGAPAQ